MLINLEGDFYNLDTVYKIGFSHNEGIDHDIILYFPYLKKDNYLESIIINKLRHPDVWKKVYKRLEKNIK